MHLFYRVINGSVMTIFFTVDQEFDTVSGFLLKRTKDMVNKYRQLLVREAQVRSRFSTVLRAAVFSVLFGAACL